MGVVRGDPSLQRDVGTLREEAGKKTAAGAVFNEGDVVRAEDCEREAAGLTRGCGEGGCHAAARAKSWSSLARSRTAT